jgi:hypothetical protein
MLNWFRPKQSVEVFVRHCHYSQISAHKKRIPGFSRERCFDNLLSTLGSDHVHLTFFLDTAHPMEGDHFIKTQTQYPVIEIKAGCETSSFLQLLDYVSTRKFHKETILYFLEDDYIHRKNWVSILKEGFTLSDAAYVTLYDHRDKYFFEDYRELRSKIYHTSSCHWRTTPSTTNTYAMRFKTLLEDLPIHRAFSEGRKISADHEKFCHLAEKGKILISSIPGWATHAEPEFASPCIDWEEILK